MNTTKITRFPKIKPFVEEWNRMFAMPYHEYRHNIKEIALSNWQAVTSRVYTDLEFADDDYVIPTDDDDWLHPNIQIDTDADLVTWKSIVHQSVMRQRFSLWPKNNHLCANNYALRGSFLNRLDVDKRQKILQVHSHVLRIADRSNAKVLRLNDVYSCYNWHPGSASAMNNRKGKTLSRAIPNHLRDSEKYPWINPYVKEFCKVLQRVPRKQIKMC